MSDYDVIISGFAVIINRKYICPFLYIVNFKSGSGRRKGRIVNLNPGSNSICPLLASGKLAT